MPFRYEPTQMGNPLYPRATVKEYDARGTLVGEIAKPLPELQPSNTAGEQARRDKMSRDANGNRIAEALNFFESAQARQPVLTNPVAPQAPRAAQQPDATEQNNVAALLRAIRQLPDAGATGDAVRQLKDLANGLVT